MYFKKLELTGFKSFFERTILHFEPGITAVVGPNGCGKSNIFDSIRWVLGEQSAKSLRGCEMQDVIFNGTDTKEPLGMAEVSLTFDNENRFFNLDHPEVAITRRIFRSGESEYLLNKTPVRLKDILDILLGTGIGAESYSIVAQGKIDLVLSSRPEDRRLVFDEASGITKYKAQKREAVRKLEETEQNLLRVNDIITEVKRQIASLERQANKARRYKEVFEELKNKEINSALLQKKELLSQKELLAGQLKEIASRETTLADLLVQEEARVANRQGELRVYEDKIMSFRNQILNLENLDLRNNENISLNKERIAELESLRAELIKQGEQVKARLVIDEEKLSKVKTEYGAIKNDLEIKSGILSENESRINGLNLAVKNALEAINSAKKDILDLAAKASAVKNEISDSSAKEQIFSARKKRLLIENAKVAEEKSVTSDSLNSVTEEAKNLRNSVEQINLKICGIKNELEKEGLSLSDINSGISALERERMTLESHKEFLSKLKTKYEDISESMNALIYLDKAPAQDISGLVIKIKGRVDLNDADKIHAGSASFKLSGEAKPFELDTKNIEAKLIEIGQRLQDLKNNRSQKEAGIEELNQAIVSLQQGLRQQEIALANKETSRLTVLEQFNKIKEEEEIINLELSDVGKEISLLKESIESAKLRLAAFIKEQGAKESLILEQDRGICANNKLREDALMLIAQTRAELEGLRGRTLSDEATLKILEGAYQQDKSALIDIEAKISDGQAKKEHFESQIRQNQAKIGEFMAQIQAQKELLAKEEAAYLNLSQGSSESAKRIEASRKEFDMLKDKLYQLQMQDKDMDYKYSALKERMSQVYKLDLEALWPDAEVVDLKQIIQEIEKLKEKLESYGTVNLVAIEEYDELKKRYDFLIQQETDLTTAKESLHQAILKINRTTKQMFMETFEKVRLEFRNYFKLLFNGGDAQVFLVDEQDPLESGIEIICRPPGKKLQNVLLLSGGEKSLSAIALIFAIFKVKPSPFCILDEIDAALDEANVDRFSRALQEFAKSSQFIVITHNKKTIANADLMYGITMEQSGVSKIVSVKFAKDKAQEDIEPQVAIPDAV